MSDTLRCKFHCRKDGVMLMHRNIHKLPQSNMYYPRTILYLDCIHRHNHETILFFSYFSAKYAYLAMHIKKDGKH